MRDPFHSLKSEALNHRAVRHPYLKMIKSCNSGDHRQVLKIFAEIYYGYSSHFPKYLTGVISKLDDPRHREILIDNLTEERGHYEPAEYLKLKEAGIKREWIEGISHPQLFMNFAKALSVNLGQQTWIEVECWREQFYSLIAHGTPEEAIGAIGLGTEFIVKAVYQNFIPILKLSDLSPQDYVFFPLHTEVDDHHQESLMLITRELVKDQSSFDLIRKGMLKALMLRSSFWDSLLERTVSQLNSFDELVA